jgi:hypothetical protein
MKHTENALNNLQKRDQESVSILVKKEDGSVV